MIQFFRKIRYGLMGKNETGKYLKYAIGEILLVVIGILIALSINNWNQGRILNVQEEKILNVLLVDLRQAKAASLISLEREEQILSGIAKILRGVEARNAIAKSAIVDSLYKQAIWSIESAIPVINTYTDLKNAGQTSLISNEEIRVKFTSLENSLNELNDQINDRLNFQQMHSDKWAINNMNFVRTLKLEVHNYKINLGPENNYSEMFNDQRFLNLITGKLLLSLGVVRDRKTLLAEINALMELVDNELEKN